MLAAGVIRQDEDCERLAEYRRATIVARFPDNDVSASGRKLRPEFEKMLKAIDAGQVDVVIAYSLDRLTRNSRDRVRLIESCQKAGVTIWLVRGSDLDLTTANGRMVAGILAEVAQAEIEVEGERTRRARKQAAEAGLPVSGHRPFGFDDDAVSVRPAEAEAIRQAYAAALGGSSTGQVAKAWNAAGYRTWDGHEWRRDSVRYVLKNARYMGYRPHKPIDRPRNSDPDLYPAAWDAIVDEATWRAVHKRLTDPSMSQPDTEVALLTGIAQCGWPGCAGFVHSASTARGKYRVYRCKAATGHVVRKAEPIEQYVIGHVIARLSRPDAAELLVDDSRPDVSGLQRERDEINANLNALASMLVERRITQQMLTAATDTAMDRLGQIEAAISDAAKVEVLGDLIGTDDVLAVWESLGRGRQREVIRTLVDVTI